MVSFCAVENNKRRKKRVTKRQGKVVFLGGWGGGRGRVDKRKKEKGGKKRADASAYGNSAYAILLSKNWMMFEEAFVVEEEEEKIFVCIQSILTGLQPQCFSFIAVSPSDFYPAYKRVKACTDGLYMPVRTYTALYAPLHAFSRGKNQVVSTRKTNLSCLVT